MKKILTATLLAVLSWMAAGCSADEDRLNQTTPVIDPVETDYADIFSVRNAVFSSFIRFEKWGDENVLESWKDLNPGPGYTEFQWSDYPSLSVTCVRESDGAEMTLENPSWFVPENKEQEQVFGTGPMLRISWLDMDLRTGRNRPQTYDEVYTLTLCNTRAWGDRETHGLQWFVHVEDGHFSATRCVLDSCTYTYRDGHKWEIHGHDVQPWESDEYRFLYSYLPEAYPQHLVGGVFRLRELELDGDWEPVNFFIKLQDQEGHDLLDPNDPQHNYIDGTTITFRGETYEVSRLWYERNKPYIYPRETRALPTTPYGLYLAKSSWFSKYYSDHILYFGEIDGAEAMDEDLVLTWPDGRQNVIHYHSSDYTKLECIRWYELDGVRQESSRILIRR